MAARTRVRPVASNLRRRRQTGHAAKRVRLPHKFEPRNYQLPQFQAYERGIRRFVKVWHRRAGKDKCDWNFLIQRAQERVGAYWYVLPTYKQAKKIIWRGRDKAGVKFLDHIPKELIKAKNETELLIELTNGSIIQLVGSDNFDNLVGTNPVGIVLSEWSLQRPAVWEYLWPILAENDGWAVFNFTPRGENHAYDLLTQNETNPLWFTSVLSIEDTGAVPLSVIEEARAAGMPDEVIQQEFYVNFQASNTGTYYGLGMRQAKQDGRIGDVPHVPGYPVHTCWDLGVNDSTVIWFWQEINGQRRFIDFYEATGFGLDHYAAELQKRADECGYVYGRHWGPHDLRVREIGNQAKSRLETAKRLGIKFEVVKLHEVLDGINEVRKMLPECCFDAVRCKDGINALKSYHKEFDEKRMVFKPHPEHDWSSHAADSFRYGVMATGPRKVKWS